MNKTSRAGLIGSAIVGVTAMLALGVAYLAFANGFVLAKLWEWHAVPYGLPRVGWATFAAVALALNVLRPPAQLPKSGDKPDKHEAAGRLIGVLVAPWSCLLLGWWLAR